MSFDLSQLKGEQCELFPYHRGAFPRDTLYRLWAIMEEDGAADKVFHGQPIDETLPQSTRGDLFSFCELFSHPMRFLLMVVAKATGEFAGLIWFDDLVAGERASANLFFRRKYYGPLAMEAGQISLRYAFAHLNVKVLWAFTPWKEAAGYARRLGFKHIATLAAFTRVNGQMQDVQILRLPREEYSDGG